MKDVSEASQVQEIQLPNGGNVFGFFLDFKKGFVPWEDMIPGFKYSSDIPYFQIMVPTTDTVKYSYLLENLLSNRFPTLLW